MAIVDTYIDTVVAAFRNGKLYTLFSPSFWIKTIAEGVKRAAGTPASGQTVVGAQMENFFSGRDENNPASPFNRGGGMKIP